MNPTGLNALSTEDRCHPNQIQVHAGNGDSGDRQSTADNQSRQVRSPRNKPLPGNRTHLASP
jgi:hypothetical protein